MLLSALVTDLIARRSSGGIFLEDAETTACALKAARLYLGYANPEVMPAGWVINDTTRTRPLSAITPAWDVSTDEWAVIGPLFEAYVEYESSLRLEASRGLGSDVYGITSSEAKMNVTQLEEMLPMRAFYHPIMSSGFPADLVV